MSIYGAFDYLDVLSRASLLAPRNEAEEAADEAARAQVEEEDDDYLLVLDDAAATTVAESSDDTTLPSEIHVSDESSSSRVASPFHASPRGAAEHEKCVFYHFSVYH